MNVISMLYFFRSFCFVGQAILKLKHESKIEHIFLVGNTGKKFEITFVSISYYISHCLGLTISPSVLVQVVTLCNKSLFLSLVVIVAYHIFPLTYLGRLYIILILIFL